MELQSSPNIIILIQQRVITSEEAKKKIEEIVSDLFPYKDG
jgi:hypothetical protein